MATTKEPITGLSNGCLALLPLATWKFLEHGGSGHQKGRHDLPVCGKDFSKD
jgi:hypothetical protein